MPRALVLVNPVASRATPDAMLNSALHPLRDRGWSIALRHTAGPGTATALTCEAVAAGFQMVVAAGGDGTVNEVVQGLVSTETFLGVLPLGMVNIWATEIGLPRDVHEAVRVLAEGEVRTVDVGVVDWSEKRRYFLLMAGIGFDAAVVRRTDPRLKRLVGPLAYIWNGLLTALGNCGGTVEIDLPGETLRREALLVLAGNTRRYAGRISVTPMADADDGLLDLCLFSGRGVGRAALYAAELVRGSHLRDSGVTYRIANRIAVRAKPPLPVQVDGEYVGMTPIELWSQPRALRALVPSSLSSGLLSMSDDATRAQ